MTYQSEENNSLKKFDNKISAYLLWVHRKIKYDLVKNKRKAAMEFCGWYGLFSLVFAYVSLSFFGVLADSEIYQLLNFTGGIGLAIFTFYKKAYQSTVTHSIWALIGIISLIRILL